MKLVGSNNTEKIKCSHLKLRQKELKNTKIGKIKINFAQCFNEIFIEASENNEDCLFAVDFLPGWK